MEEDIKNVMQRKIWTAEQLLSQAKGLAIKAKELPEEVRKSIPIFSGKWSEDSVKRYLETFGIAIRNPLRYKNRKLLEDNGIQTKGISEEIFDDSTGVEDIVSNFSELRKFNEVISGILIEKEILLGWLKEGIDKAKEKLKEILNARTAFQRILESGINENVRDELIQRSIGTIGFVGSAEDTISKARFINEFNIPVKYERKFDEFSEILGKVHSALTKLQQEYVIRKEEISELVKQKPLHEAYEILEKKLEDCSKKKGKLLEEWKTYSTTLKSIGRGVPEVPHGLHELEEEIKKLESECLSTLGKDGLKLLKFLRGEENFPDEIPVDDIRKTLEILRPFFVKFLREEG